MYEALIKVNVADSLDRKLSQIREQLFELADRLVSEYGLGADECEQLFNECVDIAENAEREGH